ncbi:MAG: hypothetical protein AAFX53_05050, partial [Bacteroidota bacterium]
FIALPFFAFLIYSSPFLLSKIGAFWIILWMFWYVMFRLPELSRAKPKTIDVPYLEYLGRWQSFLELNISLGRKAIYWYGLAPGLGCFAIILGPYLEGQMSLLKLLGILSVFFVSIIALYFYLKWVVKKLFEPRLKKTNELIQVMKEQKSV